MKNLLAALALCCAPLASAVTLQEYGVGLTATGLVDHVSGLEWLDSGLTEGGLDELQGWLDDGWRIASEEEVYFLATRQVDFHAGGAALILDDADLTEMMDRLSVEIGGDVFGSAWICRSYGDPDTYCASANSFGTQFALFVVYDYADARNEVYMSYYISEVPMYGSLDCDYVDCSYLGRSLLVRAVPLPGAAVLLLSGLAALAVRFRGLG